MRQNELDYALVSKAKWYLQRCLVVCLTQALQHNTIQPPIGKSYTCCAMPAAWHASGATQAGAHAWGVTMTAMAPPALTPADTYGHDHTRRGSLFYLVREDGAFYCFWTQIGIEKHARFFVARSVHDM